MGHFVLSHPVYASVCVVINVLKTRHLSPLIITWNRISYLCQEGDVWPVQFLKVVCRLIRNSHVDILGSFVCTCFCKPCQAMNVRITQQEFFFVFDIAQSWRRFTFCECFVVFYCNKISSCCFVVFVIFLCKLNCFIVRWKLPALICQIIFVGEKLTGFAPIL